jgi:ATP-dependent Clp protease ATP-binding subunit ClpA
MFERFTDRARRVVVLAQEEARMLGHGFIGTEHLLLGTIAQGDGVGGKALEQLGLRLEGARAEVERLVARGTGEVPSGHIPFTPRAKGALEHAFRESLHLGHTYIGTEHVLLGLLRESDGVAAQLLRTRFGDVEVVRNTVISLLSGLGAPTVPPAARAPLPTDRWSPAQRAAMELAAGRARAKTVGTHHVLAVFAEWPDDVCAAAQVLRAGGFDASKLATPIADWDVADTRDETEEQWAQRVAEVTVSADGLTITLRDPQLRERVIKAMASDDSAVQEAFRRAVQGLRDLPPAESSD